MTSAIPVSPGLVEIHAFTRAGGNLQWGTVAATPGRGGDPALVFRALSPTNGWPEGTLPIFLVDREAHRELRRRPPRGQENFTEPFFFALPPDPRDDAVQIAGRWACTATNLTGARHFPAFELTCDEGEVSGRFDPNTEYRFAFVQGGSFRTNRLRLQIDYINDHYLLEGTLEAGRLSGTWRLVDGEDHGTWDGKRWGDGAPPTILPGGAVPLYEWRRAGEPAPRYTTGRAPGPAGWTRSPAPICRVWPPIR